MPAVAATPHSLTPPSAGHHTQSMSGKYASPFCVCKEDEVTLEGEKHKRGATEVIAKVRRASLRILRIKCTKRSAKSRWQSLGKWRCSCQGEREKAFFSVAPAAPIAGSASQPAV